MIKITMTTIMMMTTMILKTLRTQLMP